MNTFDIPLELDQYDPDDWLIKVRLFDIDWILTGEFEVRGGFEDKMSCGDIKKFQLLRADDDEIDCMVEYTRRRVPGGQYAYFISDMMGERVLFAIQDLTNDIFPAIIDDSKSGIVGMVLKKAINEYLQSGKVDETDFMDSMQVEYYREMKAAGNNATRRSQVNARWSNI